VKTVVQMGKTALFDKNFDLKGENVGGGGVSRRFMGGGGKCPYGVLKIQYFQRGSLKSTIILTHPLF